MNCTPSKILIGLLPVVAFAVGCSPTKPIYLNDTNNLSHYVEQATKVEYPDVEYASLEEVTQAHQPITVLDPNFNSYEDITLEDAVSYALLNAKVIRGYGTPGLQATRVSPGQDNLSNSPVSASTTFNVAIRESEPGFIGTPGQISNPGSITTNTGLDGNQGVESALAEFDAQFTSSIAWTKSDEPRNGASFLNSRIFEQDQATWQAEIAKKAANGTQIFFRNINQWTQNNNPLLAQNGVQALDSWYRASFEAEIRQPILRGRGTFINRMPIVISRLGTDQEIANLEANLQNFVTNLEIRYWDLYCAYRSFEAAKTGAIAALETYRIVQDQFDQGAEVNIQQLAQSKEQYHFFNAQVIDAFNNVLNAEGQLRFLMGWSATDGRLLRPIDEPVMSPIEFDWCTSLCEALTYLPELRQERTEIKKRELALAYSKNGLLPELNVTMLYRWLGLGNKYGVSGESTEFADDGSGALNELYGGNFQEFSLGGTFAMPIGFRRELANVKNAQLKLAREMARVEDMELDVTKQLSEAMRALAANLMIMQESFNRWKNTTVEEDHFERLQDAGTATLDVALDAQRRRSQAEIAFYTALCEYNKTIALIHRRKGTILAYSGIDFTEGPWAGKAYLDAQEHARRRGAARQINYGWTRPEVISRGENWPTNQNIGNSLSAYPIGTVQPATMSPMVAPADSPNGVESLQIPLEQSQPAPLYSPSSPTPASPMNGSTSRNMVPSNIQQASYEEPVIRQPNTNANLGTTNASAQSAVRIQAVQPQRDDTPPPAKRLKATTQPKTGTDPANSLRGKLQWEKLGLNKPERNSNGTKAKIRIQN